jgi:hypothetical protein
VRERLTADGLLDGTKPTVIVAGGCKSAVVHSVEECGRLRQIAREAG